MKEIFRYEIKVLPEQTNTHITTPFIVDTKYNKMKISTSYEPKFLYDEDKCMEIMKKAFLAQDSGLPYDEKMLRLNIPLTNHIAWSIDSPDGLRGTRHKHDPNQVHELSKEGASNGFFPTEIKPGNWAITASINSMATDYINITYVVEVE